jgi:hypothetical protein
VAPRSQRRVAATSLVYRPCRKLPFRDPLGAPLPAAPPCILQRRRPVTGADLHGSPDRVRAPQRPTPDYSHPRKPLSGFAPGTSFVDIAILRFLLFAFMKAFQDRRAPWYLRGLIRKPLREIGVILLHDVERCFLGEIAMVLGK